MKISFFFSIIILLTVACQSPCGNTKEEFTQNSQAFFEEVKQQELAEKDGAWQPYDNELRSFVKECYPMHKDNLSLGAKKDFWLGVLGYFYARYGLGLMHKAGDMGGQLDEIWASTKENLKTLNIDLQDALKTVSKKWGIIMEIGDGLKRLFE